MEKKIEGLWDCPYCDQKGIGGLTKHCPGCGHPQDADTQFYLPGQKKYLDEKTSEKYGKGADWTCSYCGSMNRFDVATCVNCGAPREESSGSYFDNKNRREQEAAAERQKELDAQRAEAAARSKQNRKKKLFILLPILIAIIAVFAIVLSPKNAKSKVADKSWTREIQIEEYKTLQESDWNVPDGGRIYDRKRELHHYDHVIDHYESVRVQRSRQVQDGYTYSTQYIDNGDGTFTERQVSNPKYKTEYYYETVQEPVYRDDPVYYTKYYYEIERWVYERNVDTSGGAEEPYWGEVVLTENEREGTRYEEYKVVFRDEKNKEYTAIIPQELWDSLNVGDSVDLVVQTGNVRKINGTEIR